MNQHVTLSVEVGLLREFDAAWKERGLPSRSEALAKLMGAYVLEKKEPLAPKQVTDLGDY